LSLTSNLRSEKNPLHFLILLFLFLLASFNYFYWRKDTLNPNAEIFSHLLFIVEIYGFITVCAHIFMMWKMPERKSIKPELNLSVDVFITVFNEPVDLIRKTVYAAVSMDYPHKTYVLDDGNNKEIKSLAISLGAKYLSRSDNKDAKAGNLNNGLAHSKGDYIAVFDADHIPNRNFLTETLGFFKNNKVAFVQAPQEFYNINSFQHRFKGYFEEIWSEQAIFFRVIQRGKDFWNAAFFCGSCAVIRRDVLDEIGGFAIGTVTEDIHTSVRIHKKGYLSVYYPKSLAFGMAGASIEPYVTQRIRWGQRAMQVLHKERIIFSRHLSLPQKICYLSSMVTYFDGWQKAFFYISPFFALLLGLIPIQTSLFDFAIHLLPYLIILFFLMEELARGYGNLLLTQQYNMARFFAFCYSTLTLFYERKIKFNVTDKEQIKKHLKIFMLPTKFIYILNISGVFLGIVIYYFFKHLPLDVLVTVSILALINTYIAHKLISFSEKKYFSTQADYQFNTSYTTELDIKGKKYITTAYRLSSDRFRVKGDFSSLKVSNDFYSGKIFMPHCIFNFKFSIASVIQHKNKLYEINGRFLWKNGERDEFTHCIYSTNHQIVFNRIRETTLAPFAFVKSLFTQSNFRGETNHNWFPFLNQNGKVLGVIKRLNNQVNTSHFSILLSKPKGIIKNSMIFYREKNKKVNFRVINIIENIDSVNPHYLVTLLRLR